MFSASVGPELYIRLNTNQNLYIQEVFVSCSLPALSSGDKVLFTFFIVTIWWRIGNDYSDTNALNLAGIFFFWITLPAFSCVTLSYVLFYFRASYSQQFIKDDPSVGTQFQTT